MPAKRKRKAAAKKGGRKKAARRKYSPAVSKEVGEELHEFELGKAYSGKSGRKVKSRVQAIAIGLSKARREGKRVPPNPNKRKGG